MNPIDIPSQIREMISEIEADMAENGVDPDKKLHQAYITASLELNSPIPDTAYIHNLLAMSLNKPMYIRH